VAPTKNGLRKSQKWPIIDPQSLLAPLHPLTISQSTTHHRFWPWNRRWTDYKGLLLILLKILDLMAPLNLNISSPKIYLSDSVGIDYSMFHYWLLCCQIEQNNTDPSLEIKGFICSVVKENQSNREQDRIIPQRIAWSFKLYNKIRKETHWQHQTQQQPLMNLECSLE
jgi:hypothetical protein